MATLGSIIYAGNPTTMVPLAAAITFFLLSGQRWQLALWWALLFGAGLGLVAGSKVLFIGWGNELHALAFKALSGHAMLTSAVIPTATYLVLQPCRQTLRILGVLAPLVFSMLVSIYLVDLDFHTTSESVGGFLVGATVSLLFVRRAAQTTTVRSYPVQLGGSVLALAATVVVQPATFDHWLTETALAVSGNDLPYSFQTGSQVQYTPQARR